ncbi:energy-converting NiFe hydrogenase A subunit EhaA [Methanopyrus kandleri]|jgi:energy-converting hydrogenase A subunit A
MKDPGLVAVGVAAAVAFGTALALGLPPIQRDKPRRKSWEVSAAFPTPVIAAGVTVLVIRVIGYHPPIPLAIVGAVVGALSAAFTAYIEKVFPRPEAG